MILGRTKLLPGALWKVMAVNSAGAQLALEGSSPAVITFIQDKGWREKGLWVRARKPKKQRAKKAKETQ